MPADTHDLSHLVADLGLLADETRSRGDAGLVSAAGLAAFFGIRPDQQTPEVMAALDQTLAEVRALEAEVARLKMRTEMAEGLAAQDVLTPCLNRRAFLKELSRTLAECKRYGQDAVLLYLDLDGFKAINDTLGHAAGDAALIHIAHLLLQNIRDSDSVGRMGGDEFALILRHATQDQGRAKAEGLVAAIAANPILFEGTPARLGASIGVRAYADQPDAEVWLAEADAAMFVRKKTGRV